jgi:oxidoreductase
MAAAAIDESTVEAFKAKNISAFIVGYTGETGKVLVRELLQRNIFKKIILIGRREVKYNEDIYKDVVSPIGKCIHLVLAQDLIKNGTVGKQ